MLAIFALALGAAAVPGAGHCPGSSTQEVDACLASRFDEADAELNRYYQATIKRLREERETASEQMLVRAERSWVAYRTSECGAVYENWIGGSIRGSMALNCQIRLTRMRTYTIWLHWLTYIDSTPPVLPRPNIESVLSPA
ncbi:lysozyme inhibitor LprI family protein [Sphingomonas albertensis]|uniref:DUF1311 domain-containing protein n=2 Tax=Sphingomonas albertensis TaxID=2762591 RepID=A0ABR7ALR7_9SPHN|nr:lysozyme inhibitor LprI family protein [Sphingomonas albertensis]MBC3941376.1 DUF1311 domain-containing protein [Sphingomonas albertensis]